MLRRNSVVLMFAILAIVFGCEGENLEMAKHDSCNDIKGKVLKSALDKMAEMKIFFGHQSVGYNILDGIRDICKENPQVNLRIVETNRPEDFDLPVFAHARIGKNTDPFSKIESFGRLMNEVIGEKVDVAFFKFCYVDFSSKTDLEKVFYSYVEMMQGLKRRYPQVKFVHITVPLTTIESGPKAWVKRLIGRALDGSRENTQRNRFNAMLKLKYRGVEPVFDLAMAEASSCDGVKTTFRSGHEEFLSLSADYTKDGGHLNAKGRRVVAARLAAFLGGLDMARGENASR